MLLPLPGVRAGPGEEAAERVVYASRAAVQDSMYERLEAIRTVSLRRNHPEHIRAALVYQCGWFMQWLEGPPESVAALLLRLKLDRRHSDLQVLHHSRGPRRLPTAWTMAMLPSTEPEVLMAARVQSLRATYEQGKQFAPTSVLRRLSAPLRLAEAADLADQEAYHRVGACSAYGNEAFELVQWLSRKHHFPVTVRRFAGETGHDSASDYAEFLENGAPCRVIALARQGLLHGLRRVLMADFRYMLLLFCGDEKRDDALMDRFRLACRGNPTPPEIIGVAPDPAVHERMAAAALAEGMRYINCGVTYPQDTEAVWYCVQEQLRRSGPPPSSGWSVPEPGFEG